MSSRNNDKKKIKKKNVIRATILVDPDKPKVDVRDIAPLFEAAGIAVTESRPDLAIVVGGDGVFSYYGRIKSIPLLFVGVRSRAATGSKAYLAETYLEGLEDALREIREGRFGVTEYRRLEVLIDGRKLGEIFTDVSLEKGADSNALRYRLTAKGREFSFTEFVIANGVAVCTRAGSTGYYSYLDKVRLGDWLEPARSTVIPEDEIGVCHIVPTYSSREDTSVHPLRYTLPWGSQVRIQLMREGDARLFGLTKSRAGIRISAEDVITIRPSPNTTRIIRLTGSSASNRERRSRIERLGHNPA
jgi:NAD+ kinase